MSHLQARYAYARVAFKGIDDCDQQVEVVVGVEPPIRSIDWHKWYERVREVLEPVIEPLMGTTVTDDAFAEVIEATIMTVWPGASYFIEVGRGGNDEWIQVFEPKAHNS